MQTILTIYKMGYEYEYLKLLHAFFGVGSICSFRKSYYFNTI